MIRAQKAPAKFVASATLAALLGICGAALTLNTVADFEGYVPAGYLDPVGIPTKCFGDTSDVTIGKEYSFQECAASLDAAIIANAAPIAACISDFSSLPQKTRAALASMAYNIGPRALCTSSVARYFNTGQKERGCLRIAQIYTTAKGQELPGLVRRRAVESAMCLSGLRGDS